MYIFSPWKRIEVDMFLLVLFDDFIKLFNIDIQILFEVVFFYLSAKLFHILVILFFEEINAFL